jgi:hypothetical protein
MRIGLSPGTHSHTHTHSFALSPHAVVEGLDIVKKIEAVGSPSGKPSEVVEITDAGEIPVKKAGLFSKKK